MSDGVLTYTALLTVHVVSCWGMFQPKELEAVLHMDNVDFSSFHLPWRTLLSARFSHIVQ